MKRMIVRFLIIFGLTIGVSAFFVPWRFLAIKYAPLPNTVQEEIDKAVAKHGFDGMMVYVDDGNEASIYTAGYSNKETKEMIEEGSLFKIASISKLYMAVAVTKLIDQDILDQEDTLSELLPQYKDGIEYAEHITLKMLIGHRSGISDYIYHPQFPLEGIPTTEENVIELLLGEDALFYPDEKYEYSNSNYLLLGKIMDDALGYPHHVFIQEEILVPLGLDDTYYYYKDADPEEVMSGYIMGLDEDLKTIDHTLPGGTMVASIRNLGIFMRALNDGSIFTKTEAALYETLYVYDHSGLVPGYQSIAKYDEVNDQVLIMFTNTSGEDAWYEFEAIYDRVNKILLKD